MTADGMLAVELALPLTRCVVAMGADMKNVVGAGRDREVCLLPPSGDVDTPEGVEAMERHARSLPLRAGGAPGVVAVDLHPDMRSSQLGRRLAAEWNCPVMEVQHHHAHAVACLAENGRRGGLALTMDGTGWGGDGTIWGGELLEVGDTTSRRLASFLPVPLPGGDAAVRRPARQVIGRWVQAGIVWDERHLRRLDVTAGEADVWTQQCVRQVNAPPTHAAGRLFDAFAAALGLAPRDIRYEAEPAMRLEAAACEWRGGPLPDLPFEVREAGGLMLVDWAPAFRRLRDEPCASGQAIGWAMAAHVAVARAMKVMIEYGLSRTTVRHVGLSGGVFLNRIVGELLDRDGIPGGVELLRHRKTPPGDGCIALGQAVVAGAA